MNDSTNHHRGQNWNLAPVHGVSGKRYMPGLDGLRALSVMAVIAYHLNIKWAQGGLIGVGIFFVISGYLITDQIIQEWKRDHHLNLLNFWIRRARRLLPAMIVMLLFTAAWLLIIDLPRLKALREAFLSSMFYVNNWWLIFHQVSYFESFGPPSPIGHLWSLSIEEQFYLIWPIMLVFGLKIFPRRRKLALFILACAVVSATAMGLLYEPGTDPSRVYYGTDTRVFELLIGAALAILWPSQKLNENISTASRSLLDIIGCLGLSALILLMYRTNEYDDSLYRGGFVIIAVISAFVIAVLAHPASLLGKLMALKPLRFIGIRSYSLYVWHFPVIILTSPDVNTGGVSVSRIVLQLVASLILGVLSYKYIEEPFRRGRSQRKREIQYPTRRWYKLRPVALTTMLFIILIPLSYSAAFSNPEPPSRMVETTDTTGSVSKQVTEKMKKAVPLNPSLNTEKQESQIQTNSQTVPTITEDIPPVPNKDKNIEQTGMHSGKGITAIGDSVILDAAPFLDQKLPGIIIDGKVGRQMHQVREVIEGLKAQNKLGDTLIIELGTNGPFNTKQLRSVLESLRDTKQILLVNTRVPRDWQDIVNDHIAKISNEFSHVTVVDWYSASEGRDDYFYKDGVHLKRSGAKFYADLLVKALSGLEQ